MAIKKPISNYPLPSEENVDEQPTENPYEKYPLPQTTNKSRKADKVNIRTPRSTTRRCDRR